MAKAKSDDILSIRNIETFYGPIMAIRGVSLDVKEGSMVTVLGANGAGKSTLIKLLAGDSSPSNGTVSDAESLNIGYFAQHQLEQLDTTASPLLHLQRLDKKASERDLRNFLGGFGFHGDKTLEAVGPFSGGEKARLVLAILVYQKPNLLLLDEPTNHLDIEMRHALSSALQDFSGAMIIVSHDRHLLRTITDQFLLVSNKQVTPFDGDLDDYADWVKSESKATEANSKENNQQGSGKERKQQDAKKRQQQKPLRDALKKAEKQLDKLYEKQQQLESKLADTHLYQQTQKAQLASLLAEKKAVDEQLAQTEEKWLIAQEAIEASR